MNVTVLILCLIGGLWGLGLFFGYVTGMGKTFQKTPDSISIQSARSKKQQHQTAEDTQTKQQQLMDDMKQKIRDNSNKY